MHEGVRMNLGNLIAQRVNATHQLTTFTL